MSQPGTTIPLPRPCAASQAARPLTAPGRHCAACQKTTVDFSQQTDAEMLAYFRRVGAGRGVRAVLPAKLLAGGTTPTVAYPP